MAGKGKKLNLPDLIWLASIALWRRDAGTGKGSFERNVGHLRQASDVPTFRGQPCFRVVVAWVRREDRPVFLASFSE
jgi:hypothetical protein